MNYVNPILTVDHNKLHVEARYNYEEYNTASAFAGLNIFLGKSNQFTVTPMAGLAFGKTTGVIPALEIIKTGKAFDFYSESEYFISLKSDYKNFFFNWSELGTNLTDDWITGVSLQFEGSPIDKSKWDTGLYSAYTFKYLTLSAYYFNPVSNKSFAIAGLSINF